MSGRSTDHQNINLAEFHKQVVRGEAAGKIIWQPRIQCWIDDKKFAGEEFPEPYTGLSKVELYKKLNCSARIYEYNGCFQKIADDRIKRESHQMGNGQKKHIVKTPVGKITSITEEMESSWASKTQKWWLESKKDLKVAIWMEKRAQYQWNEEHFQQTKKTWGDLGAPTVFLPRVNIQHLYIDMMGVENATYALFDYPDLVEKYFTVLDESHQRLIEVVNKSPIDIINFGDNVHAGTLSPKLFEKYVLPAYQKRNEQLHKAGKFTHAHWDGDTKSLLPYAQETGLDGIEAITPEPQGDVTLDEVKEALGDMYLLDAIAAILFNDTYSEKRLIEQAKKTINLFAPNLILGISDEISSQGDIERIKTVGKVVDDYNASI